MDVLAGVGHAPGSRVWPTLPEVAAAYAAVEARRAAPAAQGRGLRRPPGAAATRSRARARGQGARPATCASGCARASWRRPSPGRSGGRLDAVKWAGMLDRRRRPAPSSPATTGWGRRRGSRCSTRSSSCSRRRPRMRPRSWPASAPRSGSRTSTTGSGPSSTEARSDGAADYSRDLNDISGRLPRGIVEATEDLDWDGDPGRGAAGPPGRRVLPFMALQARLGRKDPSAAIRAEVPVIYVAFDLLGDRDAGNGQVDALLGTPLAERRRGLEMLGPALARPAAASSPCRTCAAAAVHDALEAAFAEARARRNEGLMVKDPNQRPTRRGAAGLGWLKMKKALATHRLRRRRRRGGSRQAPWRAVGLHVRRPRRGHRRAGHDRQGLQRPHRRRDRRDDALVRGPHHQHARPLPGGGAQRWWSRSRST